MRWLLLCACAVAASCSSPHERPRRQVALNPPSVGYIDTPAPRAHVPPHFAVGGWAIDESSVSLVRLYLDDQLVASVPITVPRPDVVRAYPGVATSNMPHGWWAEIDAGERSGVCTIRAEALDGAGALTRFATVTVTIEPYRVPQ